MTRGRKLTTVLLAGAVVLALRSAPALASEGLGVVETFGGPGSGVGELSLVMAGGASESNRLGSGVAVSSTGDVYVADTGNNRVEWFNAAGQYLGEFNGSGSLANEGGKKAPKDLSKPEGIAVDDDPTSPSVGDVYVVDTSQGVVDKFGATGEFLLQLKVALVSDVAVDPVGHVWIRVSSGASTSVQEFSDAVENESMTSLVPFAAPSGSAIAVDSQEDLYLTEFTGEVERFSEAGARFGGLGSVCGGGSGTCEASGLAIDPATNDLLVDKGSLISQFGPFGEPFQAPVYISKPSSLGSGAGIAVSPVSREIYVADAASDKIVGFAVGSGPEAPETLEAEEVKGKTAVLHGELNPNGEQGEVKYHFVYSSEGTCTGAAGAGTSPVPPGVLTEAKHALVQAEAIKLEPSSKYSDCLVAENNFEVTTGNEVPFETLAAAPEVIRESAAITGETANEVTLQATINPEHSENETSYFFEYSTSKEEVENETAAQAPGSGTIAAREFGPQQVSAGPVEVSIQATVYYRIIATNGNGGPTKGAIVSYTKVPGIANESVSDLTSLSAKLEAGINPEFQNTTYTFEYAAGEHGEELLEQGKGTPVPNGAGKINANLEPLPPALCLDESLPTLSEGESFVCDDASTPGCKGGALPARDGQSLLCTMPVVVEVLSLQPGQTYYYRVVAANKASQFKSNANEGKPVAGPIESFEPFRAPTATTGEAENITGTSASLLGSVNPGGTSTSYAFEYVTQADYQSALAKGSSNPYSEGEVTSPVNAGAGETPETAGPLLAIGLRPGETYHYRLIATNKYGVQGVGSDGTFTTIAAIPPVVITGGVSGVSESAATVAGTVTSNGAETSYGFEVGVAAGSYGPVTGIGAVGGGAAEPVPVAVTLSGLEPTTTYHYRVTATSSDGTTYGEDRTFTTSSRPSLLALPPEPLQLEFEPPTPEGEKKRGHVPTLREKLAKALKVCRKDSHKSKRLRCEKSAHANYKTALRRHRRAGGK
jgi:NHL repeat